MHPIPADMRMPVVLDLLVVGLACRLQVEAAQQGLLGVLEQEETCVVQDANKGHQLTGGHSSWCPELESRTTHRSGSASSSQNVLIPYFM